MDDDEFDEFLFESIQRYDTLQMFNLENIPDKLIIMNDASLCIASKRSRGNNSELLRLQLPRKLTLPLEEEGRSKENDLKVLSGIYTESLIFCMDKIDDKIIVSEYNVPGLKILTLQDSIVGQMQQEKLDVIPWAGSNFITINETNNLICSKSVKHPLLLIDAEINKIIKSIEHPFFSNVNTSGDCCKESQDLDMYYIKCQALSKDLLAVLNTCSGELVLNDIRTNDCSSMVKGKLEKCDNEIWSISSHDSRFFPNYFGILSNKQKFYIYDKRKNLMIYQGSGNDDTKQYCSNLKLKFNEKEDKFSVSGTDSLVNVFSNSSGSFNHVFTHNGHSPSNSSLNLVTDHIWLTIGNKELIVSICDNKTLNCWDFKTGL